METLAIKGGLERIMVDKMNFLAETGKYDVVLVEVYDYASADCYVLSDSVRRIRLGVSKRRALPLKLWQMAEVHCRMRRTMRREKADLMVSAGLLGVLLLGVQNFGCREIFESHGPRHRLPLQWLVKRMERKVDLVVGARSSVFAPFRNLGLVIIDEEHEGAYKSGSSPRYHARQVAQFRAGRWKAQLIMGSATPSLEAWNLMRSMRIKTVVMKNRIGEAKFPKIRVVDMKGEKRNISLLLEDEIRKALKEKKGVILFLNRRGFTYGYECRTCGHIMECPNCSVSLTYHKAKGRLVCHTCGYSAPLVGKCPECGSLLVEKGKEKKKSCSNPECKYKE